MGPNPVEDEGRDLSVFGQQKVEATWTSGSDGVRGRVPGNQVEGAAGRVEDE